jgi:RNA polymerase-binding transcription factor
MNAAKLEEIKAQLEEERVSLERLLKQQGLGEVDVDEGFADSAQATAERSELIAVEEQHESLHKEIVAALARIEDGSYGQCQNCGSEIPAERLDAVPTTALCVTCKQAAADSLTRS